MFFHILLTCKKKKQVSLLKRIIIAQMGYGSRALQLLKQYYEMNILNLNEGDAQEPVTEITNVPDEAVSLLEETIGNFFLVSITFLLSKKLNLLNLHIKLQNLAVPCRHFY